MSMATFLDAAALIGDRIVGGAQYQGGQATWRMWTPRRDGSHTSEWTTAGGSVYRGTAGVALFLAELYGATGERRYRDAAAAALDHSLSDALTMPATMLGFHNGRAGIAHVALRCSRLLNCDEYRERALELFRSIRPTVQHDRSLDVIAGASGALVAVLAAHRDTDEGWLLTLATRLGEHLLSRARWEVGGCCWSTTGSSETRGLTGYAHGTSGCIHALSELHACTGDGRVRYAIDRALDYEQQFFEPALMNWPDLRDLEIQREIDHHDPVRVAAYLARIADGPRKRPTYMTAWCHGAPGMALARIRGTQLFPGERRFVEEARKALAGAGRNLVRTSGNYSLCHGLFGNCEPFVFAARAWSDAGLLEMVHTVAEEAVHRQAESGAPWRCGTMDGIADASLLVGEAGIGHFLLRLADERVPSVLCVTPDIRRPRVTDVVAYDKARQEYLDRYLGWTRQIVERYGGGSVEEAVGDDQDQDDLAVEERRLKGRIEHFPRGSVRRFAREAFMLERRGIRLARALRDTREARPEILATRKAESLAVDEPLRTARQVRLVRTRVLSDPSRESLASAGIETTTHWVLHRVSDRILRIRVRRPTWLLLRRLARPTSIAELIADADAHLPEAGGDGQDVREFVVEQLTQLYRAALIDRAVAQAKPAPAMAFQPESQRAGLEG